MATTERSRPLRGSAKGRGAEKGHSREERDNGGRRAAAERLRMRLRGSDGCYAGYPVAGEGPAPLLLPVLRSTTGGLRCRRRSLRLRRVRMTAADEGGRQVRDGAESEQRGESCAQGR